MSDSGDECNCATCWRERAAEDARMARAALVEKWNSLPGTGWIPEPRDCASGYCVECRTPRAEAD